MRPVVAMVADRVLEDGVALERIRSRYIEALRYAAEVVPVVIPTDLEEGELETILSRVQGLLLGGAETNVHPSRYNCTTVPKGMLLDPERDSTAFAAIRVALRLKLPILGICRGLQELNVALGGELHPDISSLNGKLVHFEDTRLPRDHQYRAVHSLSIAGNGHISSCVRELGVSEIKVNSLHRQGISCLGERLLAELVSEDGVIEAISLREENTFVSAVQWHPEWLYKEDPLSQAIFSRFGRACRVFQHVTQRLVREKSLSVTVDQ